LFRVQDTRRSTLSPALVMSNGKQGTSGSVPSLMQLIASGDEDAILGFRDAHTEQVRSYCAVVCSPELAGDAVEAAFVDFLGRVLEAQHVPDAEDDLEALLLKSTRSAAAPRFAIPESDPSRRPELCAAVPELLAAQANGEVPPNDHLLSSHVKHCERCQAIAALLDRADAAFLGSAGWSEQPADPEQPAPSPPQPAPSPPPAATSAVVRRRRGGLVGKLARGGRSGGIGS
jgi:hypothetical protein